MLNNLTLRMGIMFMKRAFYTFIFLVAVTFRPPLALCDQDNSFENYQRKEKVRDLCEKNPNHSRCDKFLDAEYRRYSDVERYSKENQLMEEGRNTESHEKTIQRELLTFCRENPDAMRCKKLKSRPRLRHSASNAQR